MLQPANPRSSSARPVRKPIGIRDIAAEAGCSIAAVSKVLNRAQGSTSVGPALSERIQEIATRLGYQPNSSAQSLRGNRPIGIGVLLPAAGGGRSPIAGGFHSALVSGMELATHEAGQSLILIGEPTGPNFGQRAIRYLAQRRINGLVLLPNDDPVFVDRMAHAPGPVVWAACNSERAQPRVTLDPAPGLASALQHLVDLGHRRILIATRAPSDVLGQRLEIATAFLSSKGISPEILDIAKAGGDAPSASSWSQELPFARASLQAYLTRGGSATAFVCLTELIAQGAYYALYGAGRSIPNDVSVVSFDNIRPHLFDPEVSSVSHELPSIGHASAALAMTPAAELASLPQVSSVPSSYIPRASTGPAPR